MIPNLGKNGLFHHFHPFKKKHLVVFFGDSVGGRLHEKNPQPCAVSRPPFLPNAWRAIRVPSGGVPRGKSSVPFVIKAFNRDH